MKLYISDLSIIFLVIFYVPIVIWLLIKIWHKPLSSFKKSISIIVFLCLAYAIPLGDVTINSIAIAKVCPTAGLHVYKTVEVEGYAGFLGGRHTLERHPYKFVEVTDPAGRWIRFERKNNKEITYEIIDKPTAEYEFVLESWRTDKALNVEKWRTFIHRRHSGDILAELLVFNPIPGWFDKWFVFGNSGWIGTTGCINFTEMEVSKILIPKSQTPN